MTVTAQPLLERRRSETLYKHVSEKPLLRSADIVVLVDRYSPAVQIVSSNNIKEAKFYDMQ